MNYARLQDQVIGLYMAPVIIHLDVLPFGWLRSLTEDIFKAALEFNIWAIDVLIKSTSKDSSYYWSHPIYLQKEVEKRQALSSRVNREARISEKSVSLQTSQRKLCKIPCPNRSNQLCFPEVHGHIAPWLSQTEMKSAIVTLYEAEKHNYHRFQR